MEFLLTTTDFKTNVNILDTDNHTPLILACGVTKENTTEGLIKSIHLLLAGGATVNAEDDGGYSSLDLAVINNNIEAIKLLLEYHCNVNHVNQDSFTPLHSACRYGLQEVASLLLASGADLTIPDGQGRTAVQLAQRYGVVLSLSSPSASASPSTPPATSSATPTIVSPKPTSSPLTTTYSSSQTSDLTKDLQAQLEAEIASSTAEDPSSSSPVEPEEEKKEETAQQEEVTKPE